MGEPINVEASLNYFLLRAENLKKISSSLKNQKDELQDRITKVQKDRALCVLSKEVLKKALDILYETSRGELEKTINLGLEFVFYDKDFSIRVDIDDKFGKSLNFVLLDSSQDPPLEVDLKNGTGAGIRTVVSYVIHYYYLLSKKALPYLFIDEGYHNMSASYRERFFQFVSELCRKKGGGLVIISHDPDMISNADRVYQVADGVVSLVSGQKETLIPEESL